ncbi:MAG: hypothetical protein C6H99_07860 [Epsilonproteobacteria bacterium]|nr:hypothetical protein [Campylobacterota bacterium]NPA63361.1 thioredoxin family protein [Campylobacterota bacterium]
MRGATLLLAAVALWAVDGYEVYKRHCASCHQKFIPFEKLKRNFEHNNTILKLKAPTINQLSYRLKGRIGDPKGDEEIHRMEVVEFIKDYVRRPDPSKSVCMEEVQRAFKTMPPMKLSDEELEAVGEWIYDFYQKPKSKGTFDDLLQKAKKGHKIIIIEATAPYCHYCKRMDQVLQSPKVKKRLQDFLLYKVDVSKEALPLGLEWSMTPTFIFVDEKKRVLKKVPGAWGEEDFIQILDEVKR